MWTNEKLPQGLWISNPEQANPNNLNKWDKVAQILQIETTSKAAENAINASQQWEFPLDFTFKWYDYILHENVFSPIFFKWSSIYIEHLPLKEN